MAAELRERIARVIDPVSWRNRDYWSKPGPKQMTPDALAVMVAPSLAKVDAVLALLPQPSPGEYEGLIEEARFIDDMPLRDLKSFVHRLSSALSSALRERDGPPVDRHGAWPLELREAIEALEEKWDIELIPGSDHGRLWRDREHFRKRAEAAERERDMIAAVNADWSAYDKGVRERVKVLEAAISWALGEGDSDFGDSLSGGEPRYWWRAELRRRSALSLVPESKDNGS